MLGLFFVLKEFIKLNKGFVLVIGFIGLGKFIIFVLLIDIINIEWDLYIIILEDLIEYLYKYKKSIVN